MERLNIVALLSLLTACMAFGQTTAPNQATKKDKEAKDTDETIVLSPFIVDASKDQGYRANNTLAGSRINTALRDIAAPITVVTKVFLEDVAARDINDVLPYLANTESTRNFTNYNYSSTIGAFFDDNAGNLQTSNRVRGLTAASITRDYFETIGRRIGFDSYNVDDITVARGPNSTLFGLGSAAGLINYSLSKAKLNGDSNKVGFAYGSFNDERATVDFNRALIKDKLAIRLDGLWSSRGIEQQPAWYHDKRIFLAAAYKPFSKTTIRADYERAWVDFNNPNSIMPVDNVSAWIAAGRPTWDPSTQLLANRPDYFVPQSNQMPVVVISSGSNGQPEYAFQPREGDPTTGLTGARGWVKFDRAEPAGLAPYQVGSDRFFDSHKVNLRPNPGSTEYVARHIALEQEILPNLALNLEYFHESFHWLNMNFARSFEYNIDVNSKLPDGRANPHFLETYTTQWTQQNTEIEDSNNQSMRATLAYKLDLTKYSKWFGAHNFSLYAEQREENNYRQSYGDTRTNLPPYLIGSAGNATTLTDRLNYTGAHISGTGDVVITKPTQGAAIPATGIKGISSTYWDIKANGGAGGWASERMDMGYVAGDPGATYHKVVSKAAVWQPYLLDNRLVGMLGWRNDKDYGARDAVPFSVDTVSWGVVAHPLKWLSLHYSNAENFKPTGTRVTNLGDPIGPQGGKGKDYGFSLELLDGKLNIKLNKFEVMVQNAPTEYQSAGPWELVEIDGGPVEKSTGKLLSAADPRVGTNSTEISTGAMGEVISAVKNYNAYQVAHSTGAPLLAYTPATPIHFSGYWGQIASTSDQLSKGYELEATYNPTPNWRIMFNVSQQKANASNVEGPVKAFLALRKPIWENLGPLWDTTNPAYFSTSWGGGTKNLHTLYNNYLGAAVAKLGAAEGKPSQILREWHANVLTNYTFTEGRLKNFGVGAAARYQSGAIIGNPIAYDSAGNPVSIDLANPYKNSPDLTLDLWVSYRRRIWSDKINWTIQLNAFDVQSNGGLAPISANSPSPDGTIPGGIHNAYRIVQPRTFRLSSSFEF